MDPCCEGAPLSPGHYQPNFSADLGFYDLRLPEVLEAQADLARQGRPLVCFEDSGGVNEFINNSIGTKVPILDIPRMVDAVIMISRESALWKKLGQAAYEESLPYSHTWMGKEVFDVCVLSRVNFNKSISITVVPQQS